MKKTIAIYDTGGGHEGVFEHSEYLESGDNPWTRLTELLDVELTALPKSDVVEKQLAQIDIAEQKVRAEFQGKLNQLSDARARIQALPNLATT
jgi:hypothetical protein